jgi:hypothetical protein
MRPFLMLAAIAVLILSNAPSAHAGYRDDDAALDDVHINTWSGGGAAWGALGFARNSSVANQFIGCSLTGFRGQSPSIYCYARDVQFNNATCQSSDPGLIQTLAAMNSDAHIQFNWDAHGCTAITVDVGSLYAPKLP